MSSPKSPKSPRSPLSRGRLSDVFPSLTIGEASTSSMASYRHGKMSDTLRHSLNRAGIPSWRTLKWSEHAQSEPARFTLHMTPELRNYKQGQRDAEEEFKEATLLLDEIRGTLNKTHDDQVIQTYCEFTEECMMNMIFASNENEKAGLSHDDTKKICRRIFNGELIDPTNIGHRSDEYSAHLEFLATQRAKENPKEEDVVRCRREVVQHAMALKYIIDAALLRDKPLTNEIIRETHRILCDGLTLDSYTRKGQPFAGKYRRAGHDVQAGNTIFTLGNDVSRQMDRFVKGFNEDVKEREESGKMDPFYLAADLGQDFVNIHPFGDGNGRMCRLLMTAYLVKYAGVVVDIGEKAKEREEYMALARKGGDPDHEDEAKLEFGRYVLERGTAKLKQLRNKLRLAR